MADRSRAVVSVIGRDQKGVVARISTYLAAHDINIEDIEQRVMEGLFIMTMLVDLSELTTTLDDLVLGLRAIGQEISMEVTVRLAGGPPERKRVAVLVTKEPHCLEALLHDRDAGALAGDVVVVLANHPDLEPLARAHGVPFRWSPSTDKAAHEEFLLTELAKHRPDLVVLARYMQILTKRVIDRYPFRIINIHPSLLPYHPGSNAYKQAWEEGVRVSGCTAHFVTEQLDAGPVILQDVFHIRVGEDSLEDVKARGRALEGKVLSAAVRLFLNDQLVVKDRKVIFRPGRFPGPPAGDAA
ncbi:MAG TPA: ACT domain-containing protein [Candidatus Binatia bacterium]|jgi:formyltetrahydrofolate deformylase|nr:ACT domain-containing protein [Candidatus Binatia bacterium]